MAEQTPNLGLTKPARSELYDVAVTNANMDKIDTEFSNVSKRVADIAVNVKSFGAVGDKATNDTAAINAAINKCVELKGDNKTPVLFFPFSSGYASDQTIVVPAGVNIEMEAPLVYTGNSNIPALIIGEDTTANTRVRAVLNVLRNTVSDWSDENSVGVQLYNANTCNIDIVQVYGFTIGAQLIGSGTGFSYNKINLWLSYYNKIGLDLTNEKNGWCNQNEVYGGRFSTGTATNAGKSRYGVRITSKDGTYTGNNANTFHSPSFELQVNTASPGEAVPVLVEHGNKNEFKDCRYENNSNIFARCLNDSSHNVFDVGYTQTETDILIDDQSLQGSNISKNRVTELFEAGNIVFSSGALYKKACFYDGATRINIPGVHLTRNSSAEVVNKSEDLMVLNANYVEVPSTRGIGIFVNTDKMKGFVVKKDTVAGYGGRLKVRVYDADGAILDNSNVRLRSNRPLQFSNTTFGKVYTTTIDYDEDIFLRFSPEVAHAAVILTGGTNSLRIKSFSIHAVNGVQGFATTWVGYDDPGFNLGTSAPTVGTWAKGRIIFNDDKTVLGEVGSQYVVDGWECIASGTPGTWIEKRLYIGT